MFMLQFACCMVAARFFQSGHVCECVNTTPPDTSGTVHNLLRIAVFTSMRGTMKRIPLYSILRISRSLPGNKSRFVDFYSHVWRFQVMKQYISRDILSANQRFCSRSSAISCVRIPRERLLWCSQRVLRYVALFLTP